MDGAWNETEELLKALEKRLKKEYEKAAEDVQDKLDEYMRAFRRKDEEMRKKWENGEITKQEYTGWRTSQLMVGQRWGTMQQTLAGEYEQANIRAREILYGDYLPTVYAINFNYGIYEAEAGLGADLGFTLYSKNAVRVLLRDNPQLLPFPSPERLIELEAQGLLWNMKEVQSVMLQSILQGESIPQIAMRLAKTVGERNYHAAVRNARTMTTAVQNMGRDDAYKRLQEKGVDMTREWVAVHDGRTRHEHRQADGQKRKVGEPFDVGGYKMMRPGDMSAPGFLVYNCRCALVGMPKGFEDRSGKGIVIVDRDETGKKVQSGMTYDEWKRTKPNYYKKKG